MKLPSSVISWIFDYLTNRRLQYAQLYEVLSVSAISTNTGAPQGYSFSSLSVFTVSVQPTVEAPTSHIL